MKTTKQEKNSIYKILNLYACLGGNRYRWDEVAKQAGIDMEVTAVELDPEAARLYQGRFPNDIVIVADAHQYLLDHFKEFDFIWSSPPCPSHSRARYWNSSNYDNNTEPIYPDMMLYQEILFLKHYFKGKYCVENVIPYYDPLIVAQKRGRHLYWTNFILPNLLSNRNKNFGDDSTQTTESIESWSKFHNYDFNKYKGEQKILKMARNLVDYEAGKTIFATALGITLANKSEQQKLF